MNREIRLLDCLVSNFYDSKHIENLEIDCLARMTNDPLKSFDEVGGKIVETTLIYCGLTPADRIENIRKTEETFRRN
jgi:hypothetical protein